MISRNPYWAPEYTRLKPSINDTGALALNSDHPLNRGLVSWWLFNEDGGDQAFDILKKAHTVGGNGGWWRGIGAYVLYGGFPGYGSASPKIPAIGTGPYSIFIRFVRTDSNGVGLLAFGSYDPAWAIDTTNHAYIYDGGNKGVSTATVSLNVLNSVGWSRLSNAESQTRQFVNGAYSNSVTHADSIAAPTQLMIGSDRYTGGYVFTGYFYEVAIYNRALTDLEQTQIHHFGFGTPDNPRFIVEPRRTWFVLSGGAPPASILPFVADRLDGNAGLMMG